MNVLVLNTHYFLPYFIDEILHYHKYLDTSLIHTHKTHIKFFLTNTDYLTTLFSTFYQIYVSK